MKVVILDQQAERAAQLVSNIEFIDYEGFSISSLDEFSGDLTNNPDDILAVLVGDAKESMGDISAAVGSLHRKIPLITLGEPITDFSAPDGGAHILAYLPLPLRYPVLNEVLQKAEVFRESEANNGKQRRVELFRSMVGKSKATNSIRKLVEQVAKTDANVLILGESGTGKEVVARNIHYHSERHNNPFVPINCGAIPPDLLESELFGHEKGAFTGAITSRQGRFELAESGTLFLDEIGDMSMHMQVKLLRVLQEKTFERVGSNKSITANVRIIAATHRDLEEEIKRGNFREDLFYRLNVFPIDMPPLRERKEDIPLLANELISRIESEKQGSVRLTPGAIVSLQHYSWPGNVRELANLIERLAILHPFGLVDVKDLPEKFQAPGMQIPEQDEDDTDAQIMDISSASLYPQIPEEGFDLKEYLNNLEVTYIKQALDDAAGVVAHAAKRLGMRRTTLVEKLRKYGLQKNDEMSEV